jgi:hypothetical protein
LPLILDAKSIRTANKLRAENGDEPLLKISRNREAALRKIHQAPPEFMELNTEYGLPYQFVGRMAEIYLESSDSDRSRYENGVQEILDTCDTKDKILSELASLFDIPLIKSIKLNLSDPNNSAQKLINLAHHDKGLIKDLAERLLNLIDEETETEYDTTEDW